MSLHAASFLMQTVVLDDKIVKFEIWDTADRERHHGLAPMYYTGTQAAIIVYDITDRVSSYQEKCNNIYKSDTRVVFYSLTLAL